MKTLKNRSLREKRSIRLVSAAAGDQPMDRRTRVNLADWARMAAARKAGRSLRQAA